MCSDSIEPSNSMIPLQPQKRSPKRKPRLQSSQYASVAQNCYRKNLQHRIEYSHPEPAKKRARTEADGDGGKKKKKEE